MLPLVLADRHVVRLIQQDVAGHQNRITIETGRDRIWILPRFRLELRHAVQPTHRGKAFHNPAHLGMLMYMRLDEQFAIARIQTSSQVECRELAYAIVQLLRIDWYSYRVQINNAEDVVVLCLCFLPVAQSAQVVAEVKIACWLYTGKDTFFHRRVRN